MASSLNHQQSASDLLSQSKLTSLVQWLNTVPAPLSKQLSLDSFKTDRQVKAGESVGELADCIVILEVLAYL